MDNQILRELFSNTIQAARLLKTDEELVQTLADYQARLMPTTIGPDGRIMEWLEPYEEAEPHHRHVSHLYGLYPANEISPERTHRTVACVRAGALSPPNGRRPPGPPGGTRRTRARGPPRARR